MGRFRYQDIVTHADRHLALTSLTADEFALLVPSFEASFQAHMQVWCLDGSPRTARSYTTYKNCPLPTADERLLFILVFLKTNPLQEAHGTLFALPQGKVNMWVQTLLPVLQQTFRTLGDAPSRNLADLATRVAAPANAASIEVAGTTAPLFATMAPSDPSHAPRTRMNRRGVTAARRSVIP